MSVVNMKDGLEVEIAKALADYTDEVKEAIEEETERSGKLLLKAVKDKAPTRIGNYKKGFKIKKNKKEGESSRIVYNAKKPWLVHLLEKSHLNRNGSRSKKFPHMQPAFEEIEPKYIKNIEKIIKNGGK